MPAAKPITIDELREEFEFLGNWEDQCRYLIELGEELPDLRPEDKTEENRVHGCQAQVWMVSRVQNGTSPPRLVISAKSDARIVDGLIVVLLALFNEKTPEEILATDFRKAFAELGLETHLVPQRRNGLYAMVERVRSLARSLVDQPDEAEPPRISLALTQSESGRRQMFDIDEIRAEFPALAQTLPSGHLVTYLDSASSAQKPQVVIDKEREVYEQYYANAYRGVYQFGDRVSQELELTREKIGRFIGAGSTREVIFTSGTTMSINLVAYAWGKKFLEPGDEIVVNELEHHANLVPWQWIAQQTGATLRYIPLTDDGRLDLSHIEEAISTKTKIVAVTGMSNVLGTVPPIKEIVQVAKANGALVLVDGAQSVPHLPISFVNDQIDFLAFSGHKIYGPSGVGVLVGREELLDQMDPFLCGGHMINEVNRDHATWAPLPAKFEAGTPPIAQAIALGTALDYVSEISLCAIHKHEQSLLRYATERLQAIDRLTVYGPPPSEKGAIISFTIEGVSEEDMARLLDLHGVFVRHGHHCTMPLHKRLGVTRTIRASFALYNTLDDVDRLVHGIEASLKDLGR